MFNDMGGAIFAAFVAIGILAVFGTISLTFIVLKMFGAIEWSWLWVLSPIWIALGIGAIYGLSVLWLINGINNGR